MTPANPLVAGAVDTATPFSGAFLLEDGEQLVSAIKNGDWISGGIAAFSTLLDTAAAVIDPIGTLIANGLGWLMDHLEPLKGWLNDLTGDAGEVQGFAATWGNVAQYLSETGAQLTSRLADLEGMRGEAIDAYLRLQTDVAAHISGAADWANAMKAGMEIASTIVQIVHDLVRDTLAQLVGSLISWAAEAVFTLGLATPAIIAQASSRVASLSSRVMQTINKLVDAVSKLMRHLDELTALFRRLDERLRAARRGDTPSTTRGGTTSNERGGSADGTPANHDRSDDGWDSLSADERMKLADSEISAGARTFADNDEATAYGRDTWDGTAASLTPEQRSAVLDYTRETNPGGITYKEINAALRQGPPYPADIQPHIDRIDIAMSRRPLPEDTIVTRGTDIGHWSVAPRDAQGATFTEASYTSTSLGGPAGAFDNKEAVLHLRVPEGTPAMWVEDVSAFGGSERELLLGRDFEWTATRPGVWENGQWHVYGEVIQR